MLETEQTRVWGPRGTGLRRKDEGGGLTIRGRRQLKKLPRSTPNPLSRWNDPSRRGGWGVGSLRPKIFPADVEIVGPSIVNPTPFVLLSMERCLGARGGWAGTQMVTSIRR